jgi:hypothetical protein
VQSCAGDDVLGVCRLAPLEGDAATAVPVALEADDAASKQDLAAARTHFVGIGGCDAAKIDDPRLGHVECPNARRMGLELVDCFRIDLLKPTEAVRKPAPFELRKRRKLALIECDDELAAELVGNPTLVREALEGFHPLAAQTRLQRPGRVVQPGVDDTRVVAALVASQFRLFLKEGQAEARLRFEQTVRRGQPDQPASDDGDVVASSRFGPHVLGL